jgi:dimethylaniline monooxygenase (N-oxide forming)
LARLYQNIFPPARADSVAYLNAYAFTTGAFVVADLASLAVAQVWKRNYPLPSIAEMHGAINVHHDWVCSLAAKDTIYWNIAREGPWMRWVNAAAGTGVNKNLGYGFSGWLFWARNLSFCNMLMGGIDSPHVYRLFDGRRKRWDGAKEAILANNKDAKEKYNL